ncbi:MAG: hypothetical protein WCI21_03305 [Alphaproteobacteria bacterium]
MSEPIPAKAVFVGVARDSGEALAPMLDNVERLQDLFAQSAAVFFENDSVDGTKAGLAAWCASHDNARVIEQDGLLAACPLRTVRMAKVRNQALSQVRKEFADWDFLFVMDCSEANNGAIDPEAVARAIHYMNREPTCAGLFANQDGYYEDLWALRHPTWCPRDIWEEVLDQFAQYGGTDREAFQAIFARRLGSIPQSEPPMRVTSAFGGMGIYKMSSVLRNPNAYVGYKSRMQLTSMGRREVGWQQCEHVSFNEGFSELGEALYIMPNLINRATIDPQSALGGEIDASAFRTYIFELSDLGEHA